MALIAAPASNGASAQTSGDQTQEIYGYITAVHFPTGFDVNGVPVTASEETSYKWYGGKAKKGGFVPADMLRVGMYVKATGYEKNHILGATSVLIQDDADQQFKGSAVVVKVIAAGAEPVFQADGYRIRIASETKSTFLGDLKNLADVKPNTWVRYEGRRDPDGTLVAAKAEFSPAKPLKVRIVSGTVEYNIAFRPKGSKTNDLTALSLGGDRVYGGAVRIGLYWHKISEDRQLQERVNRVGMGLIPAYQKQMADDDPAKIPFRFYAMDGRRIHDVTGTPVGLVLVPQQMVARLKTDDQLAAILADAVAFDMEQQGARLAKTNAAIGGSGLAIDAVGFAVPVVGVAGLPAMIGFQKAADKINIELTEQRGRVALALMADAGYDPWAAPEAWRLATAKKLPAKKKILPYPLISGYQLSMLTLQYRKTGSPGATVAAER